MWNSAPRFRFWMRPSSNRSLDGITMPFAKWRNWSALSQMPNGSLKSSSFLSLPKRFLALVRIFLNWGCLKEKIQSGKLKASTYRMTKLVDSWTTLTKATLYVRAYRRRVRQVLYEFVDGERRVRLLLQGHGARGRQATAQRGRGLILIPREMMLKTL